MYCEDVANSFQIFIEGKICVLMFFIIVKNSLPKFGKILIFFQKNLLKVIKKTI